MKLLFKQRFFSWFDSYDIFDTNGNTVFTVEGRLSWGHLLKIFDVHGRELGTVKQRVLSFLPCFELYVGEEYLGCIKREFALFRPKYYVECKGWYVEGDFAEWDYNILDYNDRCVATISKELFNWTDTYTIQVADPNDALYALMLVLAIDAEKCSRN